MAPIALPTATRRLLKDHKELLASPVSTTVHAHPLESNIYEWHGNLKFTKHNFHVHFSLLFPSNYPTSPPSLLLWTRIPHANVLQAVGGWKVCLDMLDEGIDIEYKGWSQSYTVRSILMQLEAFLTNDEELINWKVGNMAQAMVEAQEFHCRKCGSRGRSDKEVVPAWPTEEQVKRKVARDVKRPNIVKPRKVEEPKVEEKKRKGQNDDGWNDVGAAKKQAKPEAKKSNLNQKLEYKVMVIKPGHRIEKAPKIVSLKELNKISIAQPADARPATIEKIEETPREIHFKAVERSHAGLFSKLPYEMMLQILLSGELGARDVVNLSQTCKHINSFCMDGYFWKSFFHRCYPSSDLVASNLDDWLLAFAQESNFAGSEMKCYASKMSMEEDVLGLPIDWTMNPKTKMVDYIHLVDSSDFLSRTSFHDDRVRKTVWNKEFRTWCPMYLTEEHFQRALPDIKEFMVKMCPEYGSTLFSPLMVLDVIPKMMNTLVVLLMDGGEAVSHKAIEGYFLLHRLFRAMLNEYPNLQKVINERIQKVIESEDNRTKHALPNMGNWLPLLSVSDKYSWVSPGLSRAIIGEFFDRQVIWTARDHPKIVNVMKFAPKDVEANDNYLNMWLDSGRVSRRLVVFHVRLLYQIQQKKYTNYMDEITTANDMLYGRPPRPVVEKFQGTVKRIMELSSWPDFFTALFIRHPTKAELTGRLQQSVRNSLRKRYHRAGMDFGRIHASGVSRILLKGQSYAIPPNLSRIEMKESWRWDPNSHSNFLDATCTVFDFDDEFLGEVNYSNKHAFPTDKTRATQTAALKHSGDKMDHAVNRGEHIIEINLNEISKRSNVKSLVFCMSAWSGARLHEFKQPEVALVDKSTKTELATYNFGSTRDAGTRDKKSVVMAVLYRKTAGGKWDLKALGDIGEGDLTRSDVLQTEMKQSLRKIP